MRLKEQTPSYPITSVDNALRLLLLFRYEKSVRIADASAHLGVARSTAHRLMEMLAYRGFVERDERTRAYTPGPVLLDLGLSAVHHLDVRAVARPFLVELRDTTHETVHLAVLDLPDVRFVECLEGDRTIRVASRVGRTLPAHCTSTGKVMLARVPPDELASYLRNRRLRPLTSRSISRREDLMEQLDLVRTQGFAINIDETEEGLGSVAAAIVDRTGRAVAALSIAAPTQRCSAEGFAALAPAALATADAISGALP